MTETPKCLSPQHHRAECECAKGRKCEGCGTIHSRYGYTLVRLMNGGLYLCGQCLAEFNGKNPQVKVLAARVAELEAALSEVLTTPPLESGHRRPVVCSATAAESEPQCECYSCCLMRHGQARRRAAAVLAKSKELS